jgi:hypothetical protein
MDPPQPCTRSLHSVLHADPALLTRWRRGDWTIEALTLVELDRVEPG